MIYQVEDILQSSPALPTDVISVSGNIVVSNLWEETAGIFDRQAYSLLLSYQENFVLLFVDPDHAPEKFIFINEPTMFGVLDHNFTMYHYLGSLLSFVFSVVIEGRLRLHSGQIHEVVVELYDVKSIEVLENEQLGVKKADKITF